MNATAVPFNGGAPALTAVLGGQVDVASVQLGEAQAQIKAGKVVPVVTFADTRYKDFNTQRMLTANEVDGPAQLKQWTGSLDTYRTLVDQYNLNLSGKA